MTERRRHFATYLYPGSLFPESISKEIVAPIFEAALAVAPNEEGYFTKDCWYAVNIRTDIEERFVSDSDVEKWLNKETRQVSSWIIGDKIHFTDPSIAGEKFDQLRRNLEYTSDGLDVLTRMGNWQEAGDYDHVISEAELLELYCGVGR